MTRVMVTGATTPTGRALVRSLLADREVEFVLAVGFEDAEESGFPDGPRLQYCQVDMTRPRRLWRLLFGPTKTHGIEVVVHTAFHRLSTQQGSAARRLNVDATRELLRQCERHPTIKRFVMRSDAAVYRVSAAIADVMDERHPLNLDPRAPQWIRDRVEADLMVCAQMGLSPLQICVLRCAECLTEGSGSQLRDYLASRVCFHPMGYDPMINIISKRDLARAHHLAVRSEAQGVFNIPGKDTLPLCALIRRWGRKCVPVPGPLMRPLYRARQLTTGTDFDYRLNLWRFHFNGLLDGQRAAEVLGYDPAVRVCWPGETVGPDC